MVKYLRYLLQGNISQGEESKTVSLVSLERVVHRQVFDNIEHQRA